MTRQADNVFAVVDIGNSAVKVSRLVKGVPGEAKIYPLAKLSKLVTEQLPGEIGRVVLGCSGDEKRARDLTAQIFARGGETVIIGRDCVVPFKSNYAPGQAGVDRLANVAAVVAEHGDKPAVIIDAGSAITIEKVGPGMMYHGGVIMPGFSLQAHALNSGTASLPLIEALMASEAGDVGEKPKPELPGTDTTTAITGGIVAACAGGVQRVLENYMSSGEMAEAHVFITGGDGEWLLQELKSCSSWGRLVSPKQITLDGLLTIKGLLELSHLQEA